MRFLLFGALAMFSAFASQSALLGARDGEQSSGEWRNPYVTSGLAGMWDGEWNSGGGVHDSSAARLANLATTGSKYDAVPSTGSLAKSRIGQNYVTFTWNASPCQSLKVANSFITAEIGSGEFTIEAVVSPASNWAKNYSGIAGNHGGIRYGNRGVAFGQSENNLVKFILWSQNVPVYSSAAASLYDASSPVLFSLACSDSLSLAKFYKNGTLKTSMSTRIYQFDITRPFMIGSAFTDGTDSMFVEHKERVFDGRIFCVRVYSRALSESEVAYNYAVDVRRFGVR